MQKTRDAMDVLDRDFLETRCKIWRSRPRWTRSTVPLRVPMESIRRSTRHPAPSQDSKHFSSRGRAAPETVQHIFSLEYDREWPKNERERAAIELAALLMIVFALLSVR